MTMQTDTPCLPRHKWLKPDDVAAYLEITRRTAYRVVKQPGFPLVRAGRLFKIREDLFLRWVEHCEAPAEQP